MLTLLLLLVPHIFTETQCHFLWSDLKTWGVSQRGVAVQGWGTPPNIVFFYNGVSNNGSYPIVVSINSWGVGEVAWQFGERKLAWWGLEARRRRWLATDFARDIAVTKGIITEIRICIGGGLLILVNVILGYWSGLPLTFLSTELFQVNIAIGAGPLLPLPEYNLP